MTSSTVWATLMGIYIVAVSGCLFGVLAVIWNMTTNGRLSFALWMGYGAIAIGSLLFIGWLATGERFSIWILVPIISLGTGVIAVVQYYVLRSRRRRRRRGSSRVRRRGESHRLRLVT